MFYLRVITKEGVQVNSVIGDQYLIIDSADNPEKFNETFKEVFTRDRVADLCATADEDTRGVYAFISSQKLQMHPLYKGQQAYVMTESGGTFAKLSQ